MKVNVAVVGRFHAFDLANQLQKHGLLNKLITTYPKFITKRWGIKEENIISEAVIEVIKRNRQKIPFVSDMKIDNILKVFHAKKTAKYLHGCDIFIGWSGSSLEALIQAKKLGKKTILERGSSHYSYQMTILQEEYSKFDIPFSINYQQWQRELLEYELADYISIPSSYVQRTFIDNGIPVSKLLLNPYGVDLSQFKQIQKEDDVFRIIFVGGANIRKGFHYLLQAFSELDLPNSELCHIGSVNKEMDFHINKFQNAKIKYLGHKPQAQLHKYYSQGSVFVIMSIEEGLAMVQSQAMACGLPIICTTNTGGEDLLNTNGDEGYVIPIRNIEKLKEKIIFLYNNQSLAIDMGKKAKLSVANGFTWNDYGLRYVENLRALYKLSI